MDREHDIRLHERRREDETVDLARRRGVGHPDAFCDAVAETAMLAMAGELLESRGEPQPCSVQQVVLVPGESRATFGGGAVYSPLHLHLFACAPDGLQEAATAAVRAWVRDHLPALDPQRHLRLHWHGRAPATAPGAAAGFGHAPLSPLEHAVLQAERALTATATREALPALGADVTVLGESAGAGGRPRLYLRCTLLDAALTGTAAACETLETAAARVAAAVTADVARVNRGLSVEDALTVTGCRAERGHAGASARSQAANGLDAPGRAGALDIAGRCLTGDRLRAHTLAAGRLAQMLVDDLDGVDAATCRLMTLPGGESPRADLWLTPADGTPLDDVEGVARELSAGIIEELPSLWREQLGGWLVIDGWPYDREDPDPMIAPDVDAEAREGMLRSIAAGARETAAWTGRDRFDERVMAAMRAVPRDRFVPPEHRARAWLDQPQPIGEGQTVSQPFVVALTCDLAAPAPGSRVLEVGSGCGYLAAVLSRLAGEVYGVERIGTLAEAAAERLRRLGCDNVQLRTADGREGWPEHAPYDVIIVSAASDEVPPALVRQLAPDGRLLLPLGESDGQVLTEVTPDGHGGWHERAVLPVRFVPLLRGVQGEARPPGGVHR